MTTHKLIHPILGVCQEVVSKERYKVIDRWKQMYGKKFFECKVVSSGSNYDGVVQKIQHIESGKLHDTFASASKAHGCTPNTVTKHLKRQFTGYKNTVAMFQYVLYDYDKKKIVSTFD